MSAFQRLADELAAHLRERIVTGNISRGTPLAEAALAAEYGVARSTVRTAIETLLLDGLVTKRPHMPAVVSTISAEDIPEIIGLLESSESLALSRLLAIDPDMRPLRRIHTASTHSFLDKLVELSGSERLHLVHRRSTFEFLLAQLSLEVFFVDDTDARQTLVTGIFELNNELAAAGLRSVQELRAAAVKVKSKSAMKQ